MTWSHSQINRLGDRIRDAGLNDEDRGKLLEYRATFVPAYERVVADISKTLPDLKVTGRPEKTPDSIVAKLRRTKIELARMQDIAGCRLNVERIRQQDEVVGRLIEVFPGARVIDRRSRPSFGYRAVHIIPTIDDRQVEIQVRTLLQALWANQSEHLADVVGTDLKYGVVVQGDKRYERVAGFLARSSAMIATLEESEMGDGLFDDLFNELPDRLNALGGAFVTIMSLAMEAS
jgi:ppGpp synthetase/RelA/SpoT-type nucleotidyltranferase